MPIRTPDGYLDITNATLRGSEIITTSNVGIANSAPTHTLSVGNKLFVDDSAANVLTVSGNLVATSLKIGQIDLAPSYGLEHVSNVGNTISNVVQFTNTGTGFVSASNVGIGTTTTPAGLLDVVGAFRMRYQDMGVTKAHIITGANSTSLTESGGTYTYTRGGSGNTGNFLPNPSNIVPKVGQRYRVKLTARSDYAGTIRYECPTSTIITTYDLTASFKEYTWDFTATGTTMQFAVTTALGTTSQFNAFSIERLGVGFNVNPTSTTAPVQISGVTHFSDNVGVGATPTGKFQVNIGNATVPNTAWDSTKVVFGDISTGNSQGLGFGVTTNSHASIISIAPGVAWRGLEYWSSFHKWYGGGTQRMTLDSSGKLGIGTATVDAPLHIFKTAATASDIGAGIKLERWDNYGCAIWSQYHGSVECMNFRTAQTATDAYGGTPQMVLTHEGLVGIGSATPVAILDVYNPSHSTTQYRETTQFRVSNAADQSGWTRMIFGQIATNRGFIEVSNQSNTKGDLNLQPYGGKLGIGTSVGPAATLDIRGPVHDPNTPTLHIGDDTADAGDYGMVNLVRHATSGGSKGHLAFIRNGNTVTAMGFYNNTNTWGLWTSFAGVTTTPRLAIDPAGNVGIGTASPGTRLDVVAHPHTFIRKMAEAGTAVSDYNHILGGPRPGTTSAGAVHFINGSSRTADGGASTYTIRNDSGNIRLGSASYDTIIEANYCGIGVANPTSKLDVGGVIKANGSNSAVWMSGDGSIYRNYSGGSGAGIHFSGNAVLPANASGSAVNTGVDLGWQSYRWARVNTTIGYFLDDYYVSSGSQWFGKRYNNADSILSGMEIENTTLGGNYSQKVHLWTHHHGVSNGRRLTIRENGYVGIGTDYADQKLEVWGNIQASTHGNEAFFFESRGTIRMNWYGGSSWLGSGLHFTSAAIWPTDLNGTYSNGGIALGNSNYRWSTIYSWNALNTVSDDRLKHNEAEVADALGTINKLKLLKYDKTSQMLDADYNGDLTDIPHIKEVGFIAQDVLKIPELSFLVSVPGDPEEEIKPGVKRGEETYGLDYQGINNILVQAVQELSTKNDALETKTTTLETKTAALETKLQEAEAKITTLQAEKEALRSDLSSLVLRVAALES